MSPPPNKVLWFFAFDQNKVLCTLTIKLHIQALSRGQFFSDVSKRLLHVPELFCVCFAVKDTDRLSLVTYDTTVYLNFNLMCMTKANKEKAKSKVTSLAAGTCTNLCEALLEGTLKTSRCVQTTICSRFKENSLDYCKDFVVFLKGAKTFIRHIS